MELCRVKWKTFLLKRKFYYSQINKLNYIDNSKFDLTS